VQLDGKLHLETKLEATVGNGRRRTTNYRDTIAITVAASGAMMEVNCGPDGKMCMLPNVAIDIEPVSFPYYHYHDSIPSQMACSMWYRYFSSAWC
jgi:hypothetical protein